MPSLRSGRTKHSSGCGGDLSAAIYLMDKTMNYWCEQLLQKNEQGLFDFQLRFPPDHLNFILAGHILDERGRCE